MMAASAHLVNPLLTRLQLAATEEPNLENGSAAIGATC